MKLTLNKGKLEDDLDGLLEEIAKVWGWGPGEDNRQPNLLLSVTGGAKDFPEDAPISNRIDGIFGSIVETAVSESMY